jgi:hypothetical protein
LGLSQPAFAEKFNKGVIVLQEMQHDFNCDSLIENGVFLVIIVCFEAKRGVLSDAIIEAFVGLDSE